VPNVVPVLGLWHTFKHTLELVFTRHLTLIFGQLWHVLMPDSKVPQKPKHVTMQALCLHLMKAWPSVRASMVALAQDDTLLQQHHARSLVTLVQYVIPVVS
jgi:hypothetical protein